MPLRCSCRSLSPAPSWCWPLATPPQFPGGVGNTFKNKDNFASLINDVEHKLFDRLPDETWFYPGHGNDSTLGNERASIPEWRARGW